MNRSWTGRVNMAGQHADQQQQYDLPHVQSVDDGAYPRSPWNPSAFAASDIDDDAGGSPPFCGSQAQPSGNDMSEYAPNLMAGQQSRDPHDYQNSPMRKSRGITTQLQLSGRSHSSPIEFSTASGSMVPHKRRDGKEYSNATHMTAHRHSPVSDWPAELDESYSMGTNEQPGIMGCMFSQQQGQTGEHSSPSFEFDHKKGPEDSPEVGLTGQGQAMSGGHEPGDVAETEIDMSWFFEDDASTQEDAELKAPPHTPRHHHHKPHKKRVRTEGLLDQLVQQVSSMRASNHSIEERMTHEAEEAAVVKRTIAALSAAMETTVRSNALLQEKLEKIQSVQQARHKMGRDVQGCSRVVTPLTIRPIPVKREDKPQQHPSRMKRPGLSLPSRPSNKPLYDGYLPRNISPSMQRLSPGRQRSPLRQP